jgi:ADP-ribosyl-[dinitrogen reductase] hydrolase
VYAADLAAASSVPTDWAVISLCRVGDRLAGHAVRREVYLIDQEGDANEDLGAVVADVVATIDAFLAEGRDVLVHCHHGASRTGLVLRAWLMREHGWEEPTATAYLAERWPRLSTWNASFTRFLQTWS